MPRFGNLPDNPAVRADAQRATSALQDLAVSVRGAGNPSEASMLNDLAEEIEYAYAPDFEEDPPCQS